MIPFSPQERVHLPWTGVNGKPIEGTVTTVEASRFRIIWDDSDRKTNQPRYRRWYPAHMAARFRRGNATGTS